MTHPLATYLNDCRARRGTGATTAETSLYPPLEALLNAAGGGLKPRVRCFMSLKDQGAGFPDGGLFTPDQIARGADEPPPGQAPGRGVIECKKPKEDVLAVADTKRRRQLPSGPNDCHLILLPRSHTRSNHEP